MMHLLRATTTAFSVAGVFAIAVHYALDRKSVM